MASKKSYGKTISGVPVTDELIEKLAQKAEAGFDVEETKHRRRGRPPIGSGPAVVESVRLRPRASSSARSARSGRSRGHLFGDPQGPASVPRTRGDACRRYGRVIIDGLSLNERGSMPTRSPIRSSPTSRTRRPSSGSATLQEARFAKDDLDAERTGVSHHRLKPGKRQPVRPPARGGGGGLRRASPAPGGSSSTTRSSRSSASTRSGSRPRSSAPSRPGPEGIEVLAVGARHDGDGELVHGLVERLRPRPLSRARRPSRPRSAARTPSASRRRSARPVASALVEHLLLALLDQRPRSAAGRRVLAAVEVVAEDRQVVVVAEQVGQLVDLVGALGPSSPGQASRTIRSWYQRSLARLRHSWTFSASRARRRPPHRPPAAR